MSRDNLKRTFYLIGMIGAFVAGLVFVLLCDILIGTVSTWLFVSILFSLGSGICAMLSETFKEKRRLFVALKGLSIGLAVAFIGFLLMFRFLPLIPLETNKAKGLSLIITIVCLAVTAICVVGQVVDLVLSVTNKEDIVDEQQIKANVANSQPIADENAAE